MRAVLPALLLASTALGAAEDRWPVQAVVGAAAGTDSGLRREAGTSAGIWIDAGLRLPVESAAEPWLDASLRSQHGRGAGLDVVAVQAVARPAITEPLHAILGAGLALGRSSTAGSSAWDVRPAVTVGVGAVIEERWLVEAALQLVPGEFGTYDGSAVTVGVGVRF
ncbi:MAG: hypothetical protein RLZZ127_1290 [Planctomycetota bacterium]|jgi:hypothetical protein